MCQDPALVHEQGKPDAAGTHVIVIGIGAYDHLVGGGGLQVTRAIGQLVSPPTSARAVADWFIERFRHPSKPLASLSVVVSDRASSVYAHPVTGHRTEVPTGSGAEISDALKAWARRSMANRDNLAILYFCGHGVKAGLTLSLLARDFGGDALAHGDGFIDAESVRAAMGMVGPAEQVFMFDACQAGDASLVDGQTSGRRPITVRPGERLRPLPRQSTLYSSIPGDAAYGRPGEVSVFASALLVGLGSAASMDGAGDWWVNTSMLSRQVGERVSQIQRGKLDGEDIDLCKLDGEPEVPVDVRCDPVDHIHVSRLSCQSHEAGSHSLHKQAPFTGNVWETRLRSGSYTFEAQAMQPGVYQTVRVVRRVYPPHLRVVMSTQAQGPTSR